MRTVIYARYSSQLQNSRSIEDQIAVCRERADREGWPIVELFTDYAISGAAGIDEAARPGLNAMLAMVEAGGVDQVLAEATDRLARHQGDSFAIRERIVYAGARLFTLSDGEVNEMTQAFKGLMDSQFRKELAAKIKRGQRGSVAAGRAPAGLAYGYRKANKLDANGDLVRGLRVIDEEQAEIVRRIFRQYGAGLSPRMIAQQLNDEKIPGPSGGGWRASTIAGERIRQNGMLQNRLYAGVLVHNRTRKVVDPKTRKTLIRPNPADQWISQPVPELRIITDVAWNAAAALRESFVGVRPGRLTRPKHMLSGLVRCGVCGGGWTVIGLDRWGCSRNRDGRACSNGSSITTPLLEERVLGALEREMMHPDVISAYVQEYHLDYARKTAELTRDRARLERRHGEAKAKVERLVEAIANGADEFMEIKQVLAKARGERDSLADELAQLEAIPVVTLHPSIALDYRKQMAALTAALAAPESREEAMPLVRSLIDRVDVFPKTNARGTDIEVYGKLNEILSLATGRPVDPRRMVEGERVKGITHNHTFLKAKA